MAFRLSSYGPCPPLLRTQHICSFEQLVPAVSPLSASGWCQVKYRHLRPFSRLLAQKTDSRPAFLTFQSEDGLEPDKRADGDAIIGRATAALERARRLLEEQQKKTPARPTALEFMSREASPLPPLGADVQQQPHRHVSRSRDAAAEDTVQLDDVLEGASTLQESRYHTRHASQPDWFGRGAPSNEDVPSSSSQSSTGSVSPQSSVSESVDQASSASSGMAWAEFLPEAQRQKAESAARQRDLDYAEPSAATFEYVSQAAEDAAKARSATLPPLQSVLELTSAAQMPLRGELTSDAQPSAAGRVMEDGAGVLSDGTRYERTSGEEFGENGYWYRWTRLRGVSAAGKVEWEERWWEASDWAGMKEMGAEKLGCTADGAAWRETWREAIAFDEATGEPLVERSAHKWAHTEKGDEWEEKWGEHYRAGGHTSKFADKWARDGPETWHERWGEDYDGNGGCVKWTDKWAEKQIEGGGTQQWGDKWDERFKDGSGNKTGETWSIAADGHRFSRWWGENHFGNGWVQKYGNSTSGENWDASEQMDTYYNPIPHFDYRLALLHSPNLRSVPLHPRGGDSLDDGLDAL